MTPLFRAAAASLILALSCAGAPASAPSGPAPGAAVSQTLAPAPFTWQGVWKAPEADLAPLTVYRLALEAEVSSPTELKVTLGTAGGSWALEAGRGPAWWTFATGAEASPAALTLEAPAGVTVAASRLTLEALGPVLADRSGKDPMAWIDNPLKPNLPLAAGRGADLPFTTYEAEDSTFRGQMVGPGRRTTDSAAEPAAEASGRRAVDLRAPGDFVEFTARRAADSLVVRFSLPDGGGGKGTQATLGLWVDGIHVQDFTVDSQWAWVYGDFPWKNDPSLGTPRHFWDEVKVATKAIPPGARVRIQRPAGVKAPTLAIDLVDLELAGPPLTMPPGFLSIADFGAVAGDGKADNAAIEAAMKAAKKTKAAGVWFPAGVFDLSEELYPDLVVRGAGLWHTVLRSSDVAFQGMNKSFEVHDLAIEGPTKDRDDSRPGAGFQGVLGKGSVVENVWITHTKVGFWTERGTEGLRVTGCRIRNTLADGINLYRGTKGSVIENNHFRGTGDDSIALWSSTAAANTQPDQDNLIRRNTIACPWLANGIAVYGGQDNRIEGNLVADTGLNGAGIDISSRFDPLPFTGTLTVKDNTLVRCGSYEGDGGWHGALWFDGRGRGIAGAVRISGLEVYDATLHALTVQGSGGVADAVVDGLKVDGASGWALRVYDDAAGQLTVKNAVLASVLSGTVKNPASLKVTWTPVGSP